MQFSTCQFTVHQDIWKLKLKQQGLKMAAFHLHVTTPAILHMSGDAACYKTQSTRWAPEIMWSRGSGDPDLATGRGRPEARRGLGLIVLGWAAQV